MSTNVRLRVLLPLMGGSGQGTKEHHYFLSNKRNREMRLRFGRATFIPAAAAAGFQQGKVNVTARSVCVCEIMGKGQTQNGMPQSI